MRRFPAILLAVAGLTMALAVACGGKSSTDSKTNENGSPASSERAAVGAGGVDLSKAVSAVDDLQSFRFEIAMKLDISATSGSGGDAFAGALLGALGDIKIKGAYVRPDQTEVTMTMFGQEMGYVQIGTKAWEKTGGSWQATTASDSGFDFSSPTEMFSDLLPTEVLKGAKTSKEKVNGVNTTHYAFDKKAIEKLLAEVPDASGVEFKDISEANLDVWLTDEGIPVRLQMVLNGKDAQGQKMGIRLEMNITDINSSAIKIKPPI